MIKFEPRETASSVMSVVSPVIAGILTLLTGALLFYVLGEPPGKTLYTFFIVPISTLYGLSELTVKATPILMCAIGLALCYRANVWNIGAEGQLLIGALIGGYAALTLGNSTSFWALPLTLGIGIFGGLCWASIPAVLKIYFNTNEILTTIMLNYVALNLLLFAIHGPLKDPHGYNFPESALFSDNVLLPTLFDALRMHIGFFIGIFLIILLWIGVTKTLVGFQITALGKDDKASRFAGFNKKALTWLVFLMSGGLAGLAGAIEVTGPIGQLIPHISPGYGYAAIVVVFLGRLHPVGIFLASLLMALLYLGGEMVQIELGLPLALTGLFQGILLFFLLSCDVLITYRISFVKKTTDLIGR